MIQANSRIETLPETATNPQSLLDANMQIIEEYFTNATDSDPKFQFILKCLVKATLGAFNEGDELIFKDNQLIRKNNQFVEETGSSGTLLIDENFVMINNGSNPSTWTLPSAADRPGVEFVIIKTHASGVANIDQDGAETINGSTAPHSLSSQYATVHLKSDGTNWLII